MLLKKMQQYWMSILKDKKIFMGNYYICKIFAMILIVLIVFTGCGHSIGTYLNPNALWVILVIILGIT